MDFKLPPLPYAKDALEPHLSARTLEFHYEKHHRGYLEKLEKAIGGTENAARDLEDLVRDAQGGVYNNAAQVWNHTFYWKSMKPDGGGAPDGEIGRAISEAFGSHDRFRERFVECATGLFGSGYVWLHLDAGGSLQLSGLANAGSPLDHDGTPLLGMDVWEHAYYLDYQNARAGYARAFIDHLADWSFAEENLRKARAAEPRRDER